MNVNDEDLKVLKEVAKVLDDKFAEDIKIIDIREAASYADFFVIASASNIPQVKAIASEVEKALLGVGGKLKHKEGYGTTNWVLLDFTSIIIHIFNKEDREYYSLDEYWKDSPILELSVLQES